eukprot:1822743-Rhodomonas_salina.1
MRGIFSRAFASPAAAAAPMSHPSSAPRTRRGFVSRFLVSQVKGVCKIPTPPRGEKSGHATSAPRTADYTGRGSQGLGFVAGFVAGFVV